jgi:hypothetical protein
MRISLLILLVGVLLWVAFAFSPFIGFYRLAAAVQSRDAAALEERVDFPRLRQSLAEQVVKEYQSLTGKQKRTFGGVPTGFVLMLADPIIAKYLNAESLMNILIKGDTGKGNEISLPDAPFSNSSWRNAWDVWWNSRNDIRNFYIYLPPDEARADQYGLRLSLRDWQWKLTGIELPDSLRVRLAREIERRENAAKE